MVDTILLFCVVQKLYRILPRETLDLFEKMVSSKKWGMGDVCFGCKDECELYGRFLFLPKRVKCYPVQFVIGKSMVLPHCKKCIKRGTENTFLDSRFQDLYHYLRYLQRKNFSIINPIPHIAPQIPWDPVIHYSFLKYKMDNLVGFSASEMITQMSLGSFHSSGDGEGALVVTGLPVHYSNYMYQSLIAQKQNLFERTPVAPYRRMDFGEKNLFVDIDNQFLDD